MSVPIYDQNKYLFCDWRHIRCGDLEWVTPDGVYLPTVNPASPESNAVATTAFVPHGIRLESKQAERQLIPTPTQTGRIIYDGGVYRSWYMENVRAYPVKGEITTPRICYVESTDGFNWTEPKKSPLPVPWQARGEFVFFIDPTGPSNERYKAVYPGWPDESEWPALWEDYLKIHPRYREPRINANRIQCMYGAVSPDGANWTSLPDPLMLNYGDTDTTVYHDKWLGKYVMYTRKYIQERRWIGRCESEDFRNWGPIESIIWPSLDWPSSYDIYTNARSSYPGLPNYHFMFPWVYERYAQRGSVYLYSSEDGISWNNVPGEPVVPVGQTRKWPGEYVTATRDLVPFGNSKVAIKCSETASPHKYPRWQGSEYGGGSFWAVWPEGRLCGLVADETGEFFTFPVVPQGRTLRLNAKVHRGGDLRIGLLSHGDAHPGDDSPYKHVFANRVDVIGHTVNDCDPIFGNGLSLPVHWNGVSDIGIGVDHAVTIQIKLRAAELFGFEWI